MILLSGSVRFYLEFGYILIPLFLLLSVLLFLRSGGEKRFLSKRVFSFLLLVPIINVLFINTSLESNLAYSCILFIPASFLTISSINFECFRRQWLKYMRWLCIISIIVQVFHDIGLLSPSGIDIRNSLTTLYFFNCDWGEYRLSSIYWEPGQFQILLIITLCLYTDELVKVNNMKNIIKKFGIVFIAIFMTLSTTGYLCLMLILLGVFFFSTEIKYALTKRILLSSCIIPFFFLIWFSGPVQEKVEQSQNLENRSSASIRLIDNIALLYTIEEAPILGHGIDTRNQNDVKRKHGSITSSNGWLYAASGYGVVYVWVILVVMYRRIMKMPRGVPAIFIWLSIVISQCNEYIIFYPYLYLFIFKFKPQKYIIKMA